MRFARLLGPIKACFLKHRMELGLFLGAVIISSAVALAMRVPADDTINRYSPMAEAFARGDFRYAWHPRFGVYFSSIAGIFVWTFGVSGTTASQMLAVLLYSLAVFPLFRLFRMLFDTRIAVIATLLYLGCSHLLRMPADGLRDNGKTLALALIACGLVELSRRPKAVGAGIRLVVGCALLTVLRAEGALVALFAGIAGIWLVRNWRHIIPGVALYILILTPQLCYNWHTIGYPVPDMRHGAVLDRILFDRDSRYHPPPETP